MVLAAVREDRMPGGRNSGAVYNLYKVCTPFKFIHNNNNQMQNNLIQLLLPRSSTESTRRTIRRRRPEGITGLFQMLRPRLESRPSFKNLGNMVTTTSSPQSVWSITATATVTAKSLLHLPPPPEWNSITTTHTLPYSSSNSSNNICSKFNNIISSSNSSTVAVVQFLALPTATFWKRPSRTQAKYCTWGGVWKVPSLPVGIQSACRTSRPCPASVLSSTVTSLKTLPR